MLISIALTMMYLLCIDEYYRVKVLRWIGADLMVAAVCGTISLIIFGAQGDGRDFMPDWEQNYLSWSFGLAFVGKKMETEIEIDLTCFPRSGDAVCDVCLVPGGGEDTAEEGVGQRQHGEAAAVPHAGGEDRVGRTQSQASHLRLL